MLLLCLLIIISLVAIYFFIRLFYLKREVKKIGKQLQNYVNQRSNKKIDMSLLDQDMENLGMQINQLIDLHIKEKRERILFENELKQTIANMSHDLRTPLTSILGYIQMADSNEITDIERKEFIEIAKKRAKRLEILLNEFYELSVIESADYELKFERFNMKNVTIDVLMSFFDQFNDKNMEPMMNMPESDVFITADRYAVISVLENLISNAINYSSGNVVVCLEEEDLLIRLAVKNDAPDLTEKDVELLFDRFYMADKSRSDKSTGLGLSIVKSLMIKMNGDVTGRLDHGQLSIICEWKTSDN